ncbi:protealysin inhibitor emfourin [Calothrix sp. 336/3]|uniref:protealysin inhibitor emfourin n=1 Tax=Calothrix sp. 336/3 TaxID=1337936 RepID=UPI0004E3C258|nr:protealysin inhibitor emfourin [Calothrix sp. 336/3]AKG23338.1 hypothetical protein IJ00_20475 [Calothrix sp. 336/3]
MKISMERTGGFAGVTRTKIVDTKNLSETSIQELTKILKQTDFLNLPPQILSQSHQVERFQYQITLEYQGQLHTVTVPETAMDDNLKSLIEWIQSS